MHIAVYPEGGVGINVVSLGLEFEVRREIVTTIDLCDAVQNVSVKDLEGFAVNRDLFPTELGAKCR